MTMKRISIFSIMAIKSLMIILLYAHLIQCFSAKSVSKYIYLPEGVIGPETVVFDCEGKGPYVGVSDGRILKWRGSKLRWQHFSTVVHKSPLPCNASTVDTDLEAACGRPLGLKFNPKTCELYIADSYYGLMKVSRRGGVATPLVSSAGGKRIKFANDLDIDPTTGVVYFTDTSTIYSRWQWPLVIANMDITGRLIRYDPTNGKVSVLLHGLAFPNGVALSKHKDYLLWIESATMRVYKYWLSGPKRRKNELLLQLNGYPDNINRVANSDHYWIAMGYDLPTKIDSSGKIMEVLKNVSSTSDVSQIDNMIWLGSLESPYVEMIRS